MQRGTQRAAARDGAHLAWWLPLRDHQFSCRVGARHLNHLFFLLILRGYPRELRGFTLLPGSDVPWLDPQIAS